MTLFDNALGFTLGEEGGRVDNPKDPGGRTAYGITQRTYDAWRHRKGLANRDVYLIDASERATIYKEGYWDTIGGDKLPAGVGVVTFDYAVNSGVSRALGVLRASEAAHPSDPVAQIDYICTERLTFLKALSTYAVFGKGWSRRVSSVKAFGLAQAAKAPLAPVVAAPAPVVAPKPSLPPVVSVDPPLPPVASVGFWGQLLAAVISSYFKKTA